MVLTFKSEFELEVAAIKKLKSCFSLFYKKWLTQKAAKKTNNTTIRTQEQKEPKEMLRNVIKRRKTINKLNNTKKKNC